MFTSLPPSLCSWSLNQRLFTSDDRVSNFVNGTDIYIDRPTNTLIATSVVSDTRSQYVFKTFGNGWSLQQKLDADYAELSKDLQFGHPGLAGGFLTSGGADGELQIRSKFRNDSCLLFWLSDHFLDGWDTAVLTLRAPDLTNDTFHPHCDQVDPFLVRYCPHQPEDEGVYIAKVFAATQARFFWEISWQVQIEKTGEWYKGDFATKMMFNFNATTMDFALVSIENEIDMSAPCYRCTTIASQSWQQLQATTNAAFWPLQVTGAPYYISDSQGRLVWASGKMCAGVAFYECYQTLPDGEYILRLGGGLYGRETRLPEDGAFWSGCGKTGGHREQMLFGVIRGACHALQIFNYTTRCAQPEPVSTDIVSGFYQDQYTRAPSFGGTIMPTQHVFGNPYQKGKMYAVGSGKEIGGDLNLDGGVYSSADAITTSTNNVVVADEEEEGTDAVGAEGDDDAVILGSSSTSSGSSRESKRRLSGGTSSSNNNNNNDRNTAVRRGKSRDAFLP